MTQYIGSFCACNEVKGNQRAWKWLADTKAAVKSTAFAAEPGDYLNVLVYEFIDKKAPAPGGQDEWIPETVRWVVCQLYIDGATRLTATAALLALVTV